MIRKVIPGIVTPRTNSIYHFYNSKQHFRKVEIVNTKKINK